MAFLPQRDLLNTALFVCAERGGGGAGMLPGWERCVLNSGRTGPVRTCTHIEVQTECSSADERAACLEETRPGKEVHF